MVIPWNCFHGRNPETVTKHWLRTVILSHDVSGFVILCSESDVSIDFNYLSWPYNHVLPFLLFRAMYVEFFVIIPMFTMQTYLVSWIFLVYRALWCNDWFCLASDIISFFHTQTHFELFSAVDTLIINFVAFSLKCFLNSNHVDFKVTHGRQVLC